MMIQISGNGFQTSILIIIFFRNYISSNFLFPVHILQNRLSSQKSLLILNGRKAYWIEFNRYLIFLPLPDHFSLACSNNFRGCYVPRHYQDRVQSLSGMLRSRQVSLSLFSVTDSKIVMCFGIIRIEFNRYLIFFHCLIIFLLFYSNNFRDCNALWNHSDQV